ncbi:MAG TPA: type IV secretory system conjugative DNA transfer family protein [Rhodospirillaceae bacterium]|nr:type IV secretory system conjugative DNA transfer family protein [Rhodospirillaceae bacterium]
MRREHQNARLWQSATILLAGILMIGMLPLALPLTYLAERGVNLASWEWVRGYCASLPSNLDYWLAIHRTWLLNTLSAGEMPWLLFGIPVLGLLLMMAGFLLNPYSTQPTLHGGARWAINRDLAQMGLLQGTVMVLGRWQRRLLQLPETLSALCIAPPGTGKTVSVVVPTILCGDSLSMVINDVKPELHLITSGHRRRLGPVFQFDWGAIDPPGSGSVHPRWNPLSPRSVPAAGPERDLYIDRLAAVLIAEPTAGADPHWSKRGRAALAGFVHFLLGKCESRCDQGLAPEWVGREACFPMLLDWIASATMAAAARIEQLRESDGQAALFADPIRDMLLAAVAEAQERKYAHRAVLELSQLANIPDRERGSILSTMDAGLGIFKNEAVRQRTMTSDFDFADFRGMVDPRFKDLRPVTIYLSVRQQDARALSVLTGLFIEALSSYLIAHPPGQTDNPARKTGPYAALFVLDEFPQMPKLQALIDGPAVGRGQKISYLLIGQDFAQIEEKYAKTGLETLLSTTAAKIVLPLNNEVVAKRFSDMVGNCTHLAQTRSRIHGWSKDANPFAENINKNLAGIPLIQPADLMSMPRGHHMVLLQQFANRPISAQTLYYFQDPILRHRAFDPRRRRGPVPAAPTPPWLRPYYGPVDQ